MEAVLTVCGILVTIVLAILASISSRINALGNDLETTKKFVHKLHVDVTKEYVTYERLKETLEVSFQNVEGKLDRIEHDLHSMSQLHDVLIKINSKLGITP